MEKINSIFVRDNYLDHTIYNHDYKEAKEHVLETYYDMICNSFSEHDTVDKNDYVEIVSKGNLKRVKVTFHELQAYLTYKLLDVVFEEE